MKVLALNTFDHYGGAARAAYRLHEGLLGLGTESVMLVHEKSGAEAEVIRTTKSRKTASGLARYYGRDLDALPLKLYRNRSIRATWSLNYVSNGLEQQVNTFEPDIVHLHWIGSGFVPIQALSKVKSPLVWTLHDSWAFTGGCHLPNECLGYETHCGRCPQLGSHRDDDLSHWIWAKKQRSWDGLKLTVVTPSRWLATKARSSALFGDRRIEVIPNGLDTSVFFPVDKALARRLLKLPLDKKLILFGAIGSTDEPNKGFHLLQAALNHLPGEWKDAAELIIFGASATQDSPDLGMKSHYLGYVNHEALLALIYAAADVFVAPSRQENLPNTIMEAMACGTPAVAFNIGGIPDLIDHQQNGYLAMPFESEDLARGIAWVIEDDEREAMLAAHGRQKVEHEYELGFIAKCYQQLYQTLLEQR